MGAVDVVWSATAGLVVRVVVMTAAATRARTGPCGLVVSAPEGDVAGVAQGILMAISFEHHFGPVLLAKETVWWIDPAHRGRAAVQMLDAYEAWAASKKCQFVGMAGMGADPDVAKLYLRRGYRVAETHFLKAL